MMHTNRRFFEKRIILFIFVLLLGTARSNPVWAIDTITVEPVNMVDIQIVDEQGNLIDSAYVKIDGVNHIVDKIQNYLGEDFSAVEVQINHGNDGYVEFYPKLKDGYYSLNWKEKLKMDILYQERGIVTSTIEGKKFYIQVDHKINHGTFRIDGTDYNLVDYRNKTIAATAGSHWVGSSSGQTVTIASAAKEYRTVRIKPSQLDFGDDDIVLNDDGKLYYEKSICGSYHHLCFCGKWCQRKNKGDSGMTVALGDRDS